MTFNIQVESHSHVLRDRRFRKQPSATKHDQADSPDIANKVFLNVAYQVASAGGSCSFELLVPALWHYRAESDCRFRR
jgi:hypothetical protein